MRPVPVIVSFLVPALLGAVPHVLAGEPGPAARPEGGGTMPGLWAESPAAPEGAAEDAAAGAWPEGPEGSRPDGGSAADGGADSPAHSVSALDRLLAEIGRAGVAVPPADEAGSAVGPQPASPGDGGPFDSPAAGGLPPHLLAQEQALEAYLDTGDAPVLGTPQHRRVPHGHRVPLVRCLPLHACDLVFEAGEQLTGWALGDSERWLVESLASGAGDAARPHLLVKPTDYELATNLIVLTDRRTYRLELESPSHAEVHEREAGAEPAPYDLSLSWWYPDEWVERRQARRQDAEAARVATDAARRAAVQLDDPLDPERLSFAYDLRQPWRRSRRLPWEPVTVFDDGRRVYLRLPAAARRGHLPVLLGLLDDGEHYPLNTRVQGEWMIVPTLFERAELVIGTGKGRRSLTLVATDGGGGS